MRWIYGLILAAHAVALTDAALFEGIEGDDGPVLVVRVVGLTALAVSGTITLAAYKLLTIEPET